MVLKNTLFLPGKSVIGVFKIKKNFLFTFLHYKLLSSLFMEYFFLFFNNSIPLCVRENFLQSRCPFLLLLSACLFFYTYFFFLSCLLMANLHIVLDFFQILLLNHLSPFLTIAFLLLSSSPCCTCFQKSSVVPS